ncbi:CBS domain-containing protein [Streptomyces sp. NPDC054940]
MNPSMDDRRILAEIERCLARDDPELVSLTDTLNHQFPHEPADADDHGGGHGLRRKVIVALLIVALAGLILTAILAKPSPSGDNQGPPAKSLAPAVTVHTPRRGPRTPTDTGPTLLAQRRQQRNRNSRGEEVPHARDLAQPYVSVSTDTDAVEAVRLLVEQRLPGLLVVGPAGQPIAMLPASNVVRTLVSGCIQEDPVLAAVIDEPHADRLCRALAGRTLADRLPAGRRPFLPAAGPDRTTMELTELLARTRSPLIAIVERDAGGPDRLLGVVTAAHLLERLLQA